MDPVAFATPEDWHAWLDVHAESSDGVWLQIAKKGSGRSSVTHAEALEVALCWGWIDGQRRRLDDAAFLQRFTPRRAKSIWSQVNCAKALALIAEGRMQPRGRAEVERAKADGRWDAAYAPQRTAEIPEDLARELATRPKAAAFFATLDSRNRYSILFRLQGAKKPETRAARLAKFVAQLEAGETIHPATKKR